MYFYAGFIYYLDIKSINFADKGKYFYTLILIAIKVYIRVFYYEVNIIYYILVRERYETTKIRKISNLNSLRLLGKC